VYLDALLNQKHFLLITDEQAVGWAFSFVRDSERWFAMILAEQVQGKGYGTKLLTKLLDAETRLNGWVIDNQSYFKPNGEPYRSPLQFYLKNGFRTLETTRLETPKLSAVKIVWEKETG
jgi:GNAT superfamily N-acetyltransferase